MNHLVDLSSTRTIATCEFFSVSFSGLRWQDKISEKKNIFLKKRLDFVKKKLAAECIINNICVYTIP